MKKKSLLRAGIGVLLCAAGFFLALAIPYHAQAVITGAGSCRMAVDIVEPANGEAQGSVVLFHGLSANKKLMSYVAHGFSERGLRVFLPDFPGHGRTPGPFSPARAESCGGAFVRELLQRGFIAPQRTILAGHSMGGAIAVRLASRIPVAGVIAISPAPMRAGHGATPEMPVFADQPELPANTLVFSGAWELESMRGSAKDLAGSGKDDTARYVLVPHTTHVSLLFNPEVVRTSQDWAARVFHLQGQAALPSRGPFLGFGLGFAGLILLTAPFLRELLSKTDTAEPEAHVSFARMYTEFVCVSLIAVLILGKTHLYRKLQVFEGDYFAAFLAILGIVLLLLHGGSAHNLQANFAAAQWKPLMLATFSALVISLLYGGWLDLTFTEVWLTTSRWLRFVTFLLVLLPYHFAEEIIAGPVTAGRTIRRLALPLSLRLTAWAVLAIAFLFFHSGEILLILLAPYLALFCVLQRLGMDIVRGQTASASSAAVFGAILMAGFCLAIFPVA